MVCLGARGPPDPALAVTANGGLILSKRRLEDPAVIIRVRCERFFGTWDVGAQGDFQDPSDSSKIQRQPRVGFTRKIPTQFKNYGDRPDWHHSTSVYALLSRFWLECRSRRPLWTNTGTWTESLKNCTLGFWVKCALLFWSYLRRIFS